MYINNADRLEREPSGTQAESSSAFNDTSDINFFNAQMSISTGPNKSISPSMPSNLLNLSIPESAAGRVKRGMRDRLQNKQTKEAHALPQSLALANLEVVGRVKMLGMLVKGVDKIATMG